MKDILRCIAFIMSNGFDYYVCFCALKSFTIVNLVKNIK